MPEVSRDLETWLPVVGHEGSYEVSDLGRVRSLPRTVIRTYTTDQTTRPQRVPGRYLALSRANRDGRYLQVTLCMASKYLVHRLVAEAFLGPRPFPTAQVCHEDDDGHNNRLSNIRWDTCSSNMLDRVKLGTHHYGSRPTCDLGHQLKAPNLVPSRLKGRACLACSRARANRSYANKTGRLFDYEAEAHWQYRRIMNPDSLESLELA